MSAPIAKSQMAFELPKLSYIDTRWEEPDFQPAVEPAKESRLAAWIAALVETFRARRTRSRAFAELSVMTDRELFDVGMTRGDVARIFDDRYNKDLLLRAHGF
ncbi:MAG: DUF1127 domain-containing protein [Acetobacteraceae bacterium]|nr:DUF1127 domain-containing protein [Acetobacteraceae bacterium]